MGINWSNGQDSNLRISDWKSEAITTLPPLHLKKMARIGGLEPPSFLINSQVPSPGRLNADFKNGSAGETRTHDLMDPNHAFFQTELLHYKLKACYYTKSYIGLLHHPLPRNLLVHGFPSFLTFMMGRCIKNSSVSSIYLSDSSFHGIHGFKGVYPIKQSLGHVRISATL